MREVALRRRDLSYDAFVSPVDGLLVEIPLCVLRGLLSRDYVRLRSSVGLNQGVHTDYLHCFKATITWMC